MHAQRRRRRLIVILGASAGVLTLLVAVGVYGLLRGPASSQPRSAAVSSVPAAPVPSAVASPQRLAVRTSSESFARDAAIALFRWDTRGSAGPSEWAQTLIDAADPDEVAGLASDIRAYFPTTEQWEHLKVYGTRQRLAIRSARVPASWSTAVAQATPGQLPSGALAYTISGSRHRDGIWDGEHVTTATDVTFTVFIACPQGKDCRLLRFSRLNEPLE